MSDDNVIPLHHAEVGDGAELDPDAILEAAKGQFIQVVVLGFNTEGEFEVRSSHGSRDAMWIIQRGSLHLLAETE